MKPVCILMAAGGSVRFGANKLLQELGGKPVIRWALEAAEAAFDRVILVTGYEAVAAQAETARVVWNHHPEEGISRTIRLGLEVAGDCEGAVFMTADQPFLSAQTLRRLACAFEEGPDQICAAAHHGKRGNPVVFPKAYFKELCKLTGDVGGAKIIKAHPESLRLLEVEERELLDCDTPGALERLARELQADCTEKP